jgi:hypothetical protein
MSDEEFVMKKIVLPSGRAIEVLYFGQAQIEKMRGMQPISQDYVDEFVEALNLDLIMPEDF